MALDHTLAMAVLRWPAGPFAAAQHGAAAARAYDWRQSLAAPPATQQLSAGKWEPKLESAKLDLIGRRIDRLGELAAQPGHGDIRRRDWGLSKTAAPRCRLDPLSTP